MPHTNLRVLASPHCPVVRAHGTTTVAAVEALLRAQPHAVGVLVDGSAPPQFVTRRAFFERLAERLAEGTPLDDSIADFAAHHGRALCVHEASTAAEDALVELLERRDEAAFEPLALKSDDGHVELLDTRAFLAEILNRPAEGDAALEAARRRVERLSNLLTRLSRDLGAHVHDLAGALLMLASTDLDDDQRARCSNAEETARNLARLVTDLDDFVELESGRMALEDGCFDIVDVFDDLVDTFGARARENGLELLVEVDPALPEQLRGDGARIRQVLSDLVDNALAHTRSGSVALRARGADGDLVLEVADTGMGMDAATQRAALDPFGSNESGTTRSLVGLGLGLSIVQHLVAALGGELACDSAPGRGTCFRIRVPAAPAPATSAPARVVAGPGSRAFPTKSAPVEQAPVAMAPAAAVPASVAPAASAPADLAPAPVAPAPVAETRRAAVPAPSAPRAAGPATRSRAPSSSAARPFAGRRVLVVDDEPVARTFATRVLEGAGCSVDTADDGHVALQRLAERAYDLVLMDVQMPQMSGIETTRRLRATSGQNQAVPVLGLSSSADRGTRDSAVGVGMRDLLLKPIVAGDLVREVHLVFEGRRTLAPTSWRVLVVDDQLVSRRLAEAVLMAEGARVRHAADGQEALTALARESFDLVLLDLYMPRLGGIETLVEMQRRGDRTPVVVLSGSESSEERQRALELGARTFVKKPIERGELVEACRASRAERRAAA
jgi:CheY-like chemotaxis protein/signal transduction histidine kinase